LEKALYRLVETFYRLTRRPLCRATAREASKDEGVRGPLLGALDRLFREAARLGSALAGEAVEQPRLRPLGAYVIALVVVVAVSAGLLPGSLRLVAATSLIAGVASTVALAAMPSHVLGRWKPGYLERYLAWTQFREALARRGLDRLPAGAGLGGGLAAYAAAVGALAGLPWTSEVRAALAAARVIPLTRTMMRRGFGGGGVGAR